MKSLSKVFLPAVAAVALSAGVASAQMESPSPSPVQTLGPNPMATPLLTPTNMPEASAKPSPATAKGHIKHLKTASLSLPQTAYALTHQVQAAKQLSKMNTVNFDNIRIVKLSGVVKAGLLQRFHLHVDSGEQILAAEPFMIADAMIAQASPAPPSTNGNNSPLQFLHNVLANINVSNALNNLLNNSTVNANVSLQNVLNNNKIAIGQVVGIYIGGGGIINTVIK